MVIFEIDRNRIKDVRYKNISPLDVKIEFINPISLSKENFIKNDYDKLMNSVISSDSDEREINIIAFKEINIILPFYKYNIKIEENDSFKFAFYTYSVNSKIERILINQAQVTITEEDIRNKTNPVYGEEDLTDVRLRSFYISYADDIVNLNNYIELSLKEQLYSFNTNELSLELDYDDNREFGGEVIEFYNMIYRPLKSDSPEKEKWSKLEYSSYKDIRLCIRGEFRNV